MVKALGFKYFFCGPAREAGQGLKVTKAAPRPLTTPTLVPLLAEGKVCASLRPAHDLINIDRIAITGYSFVLPAKSYLSNEDSHDTFAYESAVAEVSELHIACRRRGLRLRLPKMRQEVLQQVLRRRLRARKG